MTKRTQLLVPTLLPLLAGLCITACGEGSTPDPSSGTGGSVNPASGGTAPIGSGGTGVGGTTATGGNGNLTGGSSGIGGAGGTDPGAGGGTTGGAPGVGGGAGGNPAGGSDGAGGAPPVEPDVLTVQLGEVRQIIRGFGLNATITDGSNLPWNQLYTLEGANALGLSILRIGMSEGNDDPNNVTTGHRGVPSGWTTARDLGAKVIGSCWSAPGPWKDNGVTYGGGHLDPEYYEAWATRIATYANTNGLYAMSIANEADFASCIESQGTCGVAPLTDQYESMVYTGKEMAEFVKVAGPIFDQIAPDTKMIAPEASLWQHVWSSISPNGEGIPGAGHKSSDPLNCECFANEITAEVEATCAPHCRKGDDGALAEGGYDYGHWLASDPAAWSAFDIMGVHQYETQVGYAWPADVNGGVRDREVWQTEMSGVSHWPESQGTGIENGVAVARWIHSALTVGEASAWLYWWYKSYYNDNNEGLGLMLNNSINDPPATKRYYTMGNFSRYIRPDVFHAVRVAGPSPTNVMVSAYKGDNDEVVIVAINETNAAVDVPIVISGGTVPGMMMPIVTDASQNWAEGAPVAVTDGSLPASLPAMSVTTFVSQ